MRINRKADPAYSPLLPRLNHNACLLGERLHGGSVDPVSVTIRTRRLVIHVLFQQSDRQNLCIVLFKTDTPVVSRVGAGKGKVGWGGVRWRSVG